MRFLEEDRQQPGAKEPVWISVNHGKPDLLQQWHPPKPVLNGEED